MPIRNIEVPVALNELDRSVSVIPSKTGPGYERVGWVERSGTHHF